MDAGPQKDETTMSTVTFCTACGSFVRACADCRKGCGAPIITGPMDDAIAIQSAVRRAAQPVATPAPVVVATVEPEAMELVTGDTWPVRGELAAMGGRWDAAAKGWMVPAAKAERARKLVGPAPAWKRTSAAKARRCGCGQCMACIGE